MKKILFKESADDKGKKEEIPVYCDGTKEQFLKTCQEWEKATKGNTYIFNRDNIDRTVRKFTKCFGGSTHKNISTLIES